MHIVGNVDLISIIGWLIIVLGGGLLALIKFNVSKAYSKLEDIEKLLFTLVTEVAESAQKIIDLDKRLSRLEAWKDAQRDNWSK